MNERFEKLRNEAFRLTEWETLDYDTILEKFGELIVKECVRHFNEDYQRDFDTNWREDLSKSINQHFGVQE